MLVAGKIVSHGNDHCNDFLAGAHLLQRLPFKMKTVIQYLKEEVF
jgi:hypothetical protein